MGDLATVPSTAKQNRTKVKEMKANFYDDDGVDTYGNNEIILADRICEETINEIPPFDASPDVPYKETQSNTSPQSLDTPSEDMHCVDVDDDEYFLAFSYRNTVHIRVVQSKIKHFTYNLIEKGYSRYDDST